MLQLCQKLPKQWQFLQLAVHAQIDRAPDDSGFGRPERSLLKIIKELKTEPIVYNGESYLSVTIQKALLIPQKAGKLVIDPIEIQLMVGIQKLICLLFLEFHHE